MMNREQEEKRSRWKEIITDSSLVLSEGQPTTDSIRWVRIKDNPLTWQLLTPENSDSGGVSYAVLMATWNDKGWTIYCLFMYTGVAQVPSVSNGMGRCSGLAIYCTIGKPRKIKW